MSKTSERLPRLRPRKYVASPSSVHGGDHARLSSPPPGRSTLTTSAPRSASIIVASGPASTREKSATRRPSSAPPAMRRRDYPARRVATTLVISDLHLGGRTGADVLRKPEFRAPLLEALRGV